MEQKNSIAKASNEHMDYGAVLEALNRASLFELYRLSVAIWNQLNDPTRIAAVKRALRAGQQIQWFDSDKNRLVQGQVIEPCRSPRALRWSSVSIRSGPMQSASRACCCPTPRSAPF